MLLIASGHFHTAHGVTYSTNHLSTHDANFLEDVVHACVVDHTKMESVEDEEEPAKAG